MRGGLRFSASAFAAGLFMLFLCVLAAPPGEAKAANFIIDKYDVNMKVTKQNTYRIEETILVNFFSQSHGIYRDIPVESEIKRVDGSVNRIRAKIQNISCGSEEYEISREGENCRIKLGDEDKTIIGEKEYHISYDYVMGNDVREEEDELYFNVIGVNWETTIRNVSFRIEMPAEFDEGKLGMTYGRYGSGTYEGLSYRLEGNTIYGELDPDIRLGYHEGVTVRLSLPEGYFERTDETPWMAYAGLFLGVLAIGIAFLFWWLYGRDDPVVETVEFYPPGGLNSVELAFVYNGVSDNKDVVSLIVYLAQRGYIEIQEGTKKKPGKGFTLIRKKTYDGLNETERIFMEGLFAKGSEVTKKDLENSFYKTINKITAMVGCRKNKEKIFYANSINKGWILWVLAVLTCVVAGFVPVHDYEYSVLMGMGLPAAVGVAVMLSSVCLFSHGKIVGRILSCVVFLAGGVIAYGILLMDSFSCANGWYQAAYIFSLIAGFVVMFFNSYMSKRTPYGTEMLGRIRGFKNFLETAEKERLEALVMENPQYFYDILPYTYVLGISDKWMKKFESITVEAPAWYVGYHNSAFDYVMFHHFMNSTMTTATSSMVSTPSSGGGGGFSGGGAGGGGGGSW